MKAAIVAVAACLVLTGCAAGSWLDASPGRSAGNESVLFPPPAVAPRGTLLRPVPALVTHADTASFCEAVAQQAATGNPYDDATRERVYQARIIECHALLGQAQVADGTISAPPKNGIQ